MSSIRYFTAGESHGPALTAILEGMPAGLPITPEDINRDLARRQQGHGRGGRMKIETDRVDIQSGVRWGETLGSPITLRVVNSDFANWGDKMSILAEARERVDEASILVRPRPGHADLYGTLKYDREDIRDTLERASARETTMRVAVGGVCKRLLDEFGIGIDGTIVQIGDVAADISNLDAETIRERSENSPVRCADPEAEKKMVAAIDAAAEAGDTLGGWFEVRVTGLPIGLGSHVHYDRKLDARIALAVMSIQSIKGVEIGLGFDYGIKPGSAVHGGIEFKDGHYHRTGDNSGGIEGGMTTGETLTVRAVQKPISTLRREMMSVNMKTKQPMSAKYERSDVCATPAAAVIGESVVACEIANAFLEKFGGDSLREIRRNYEGYLKQIHDR